MIKKYHATRKYTKTINKKKYVIPFEQLELHIFFS